jgi:methyl-accepting chemotaxis protein
MGETDKAATSVLSASSDLTSTADILAREVDKFFGNLRADPGRQDDGAWRTAAAS